VVGFRTYRYAIRRYEVRPSPIDKLVAFLTFDEDEDGALTRQELMQFLKNLIEGTLKHIKQATRKPREYYILEELVPEIERCMTGMAFLHTSHWVISDSEHPQPKANSSYGQ
jgi:hypothetical protein